MYSPIPFRYLCTMRQSKDPEIMNSINGNHSTLTFISGLKQVLHRNSTIFDKFISQKISINSSQLFPRKVGFFFQLNLRDSSNHIKYEKRSDLNYRLHKS